MSCREGLMSPQTETKASVGFKAGVKEYKLTYYTPEYEVKDTDILAAFRVTPQPGVPPEEAGAAVAAESSTGTWTTVWTDGLTSLDRYKGRCYDIEPVPGEEDQYICYVAYPLDLFEEGFVTNLFTSIMGNVFGFKALRVERDKLNNYGHPVLRCTIKPKLGLFAKNYGGAVYECLRGGIDFTKDDENVNSQPFMCWRDHFLFCAEVIYKSQAETGEIKGHYLNAIAGTCEEMIKRAVRARELGVPIIMHDYLTGGFTSNTSLSPELATAYWCILFYPIYLGFGSWIEPSITTSSTHPVCFPFESSMKKSWFNLILSKGELEYRCGLSESMDSRLGPVENTTVNEDPNRNDMDKNIHDCSDNSSYYSKVDHLPHYHFNLYDNDTNYGWNNHINSCIDSYLHSQICINSSILSGSGNYNDNYIYNYICGEGGNSSECNNFDIITPENGNDLTLKESSNDLDLYKDLWVQCKCENCYGVNYKKSLNSKMNICEQCGYHLKMRSSNRIELSIDPGTWVLWMNT
ncbi:hypothetical protein GOBAR_DD01363 [Gossypium barbadense]|nr:hypothetical protein GOBAR_DD01363 [Gossypium barbadense]